MWKRFGGFIIKSSRSAIRTMISQTRDALRTYRSFPGQSLCVLLSSAGCVVSIVGFVIAIILFGTSGGYSRPDSGYGLSFTSGNVSLLCRGTVGTIAAICIIAGAVFLAIVSYKKVSPAKRIFMIADVTLMIIFMGMTALYDAIFGYKIRLTDRQVEVLYSFFNIVDRETLLNVLVWVSFLTIIIFAGLLFFSEMRWLLAHVCKAAIISFVVLPLLLLIAENIITLIAFIIISAVMWFGAAAMFDGTASAGSAADSHAHARPKSEKKEVKKAPEARVIDVASGYRLYLEEGSGIGAPMTTCIFVDTTTINHKYLCTLKEFKEGKVIIKKGGIQITQI